jgi:hypothetical protein
MGFRVPTGSQATGMTTANKAKGQAVEGNRVAQEQLVAFNRQIEEQKQRLREQTESVERMQVMAPPEAQAIGSPASDPRQKKMGGQRGSLMAGNTGGYNPATGGGRLGGAMRSLLG